MKIFLLGSGNVSTQLGRVLLESGFEITGIFSRNKETGHKLAQDLKTVFTNEIEKISSEADVYILAVKDDAIVQIAKTLKLKGKIVVHTSGTVSAEVLQNISENYGVFYPLQTFTKSYKTNWEALPICIEAANHEVKSALTKLTNSIKSKAYFIDSEKRRQLHLAAVWVNNFTNYLLGVAEEICEEGEVDFAILEPLAKETIRKAFAEGPKKSQSGPALRGDAGTLEKHLKMLENEEDEEKKLLYILLSKAIRGKKVIS